MLRNYRGAVGKGFGALCILLGVSLAVAADGSRVLRVAVVDSAGQPVSVATISAVAQQDGAAKAVQAAPQAIHLREAEWVVKNVGAKVELRAGLPGSEVSAGVLELPADPVVWVLVYVGDDSAQAVIVPEKVWATHPAKPESLSMGLTPTVEQTRPAVQPIDSIAAIGQSVHEASNKATCGVGQVPILIEITTDSYGDETTWELVEQVSSSVVASGGPYGDNTYYSTEYCADPALCYVFRIYDAYGDGIFSPGGYIVSYDGTEVANAMGGGFSDSQDSVNVGGGCTACVVTCPGGSNAESEACGDDTNGGCNNDPDPATFEPIACGDTVCGTIWADASTRDTDWYEVTVATDTSFTFAVEADFPVVFGLAPTTPPGSGDCADLGTSLDPYAIGDPCQPASIDVCLPPGTYWFFVSHQEYDGDPCGNDNDYVASLTCNSCAIPRGACCDLAGNCTPDQTVDECDAAAGDWQGDGISCTPNPCTPQYCDSYSTSTADSRCDRVVLNTIDNDSTADGCSTYSDFTSLTTDLTRGATYAVDVVAGTCGGCYGKWAKAFIDWNQDYDFDDPGEQVYTSGGLSSGCPYTFSGFITVPITAVLGNTTMRVVVREGGSETTTLPCGTYSWGETEDYSVNILVAPPEGACCDGVSCSILSEGDCNTAGWIYKGDGSGCTPNPCSGACCAYPSGNCTDGSEADCTTAGGNYEGDATNCGSTTCPTPGDTCGAPSVVSLGLGDLPYTNANTNCGRGDNYDDPSTATCLYYYDSGEDMIYELTVTDPMDVNILLDSHGTTYPGIAIGDACPPTDSCLGSDYHSSSDPLKIECVHLEPGTTYYIQVDTWSTPDCIPDFDLTIEQCVPCDVTCSGTAEGEPNCYDDYDDVTNGGCNSTVPVYGSISVGETVCGTSGTFLFGVDQYRDTDWYELTTTDWMELTWTVEAEFDLASFIVDGGAGCAAPPVLESGTAEHCTPLPLTTECLRPGTYWFLAAPSEFTGVTCGAEYSATLTGSICPPTYCSTSWSNCPTPDDWINNVTLNTINNSTGDECATSSYGDYTGISTSLAGASTHSLSVSFDSSGYTECLRAWIDWNHDYLFDASEQYDLGSGADTTLSTDITVPITALLGPTTMRVTERYSTCPGPCDNLTYGETEDYTIVVTEPVGACCDTTCSITTEAACGGAWLGAGTECGDDCDGNGVADSCDIYNGALDCQGDNVPDVCQLVGNDCNSDSIPDDCQLTDNDCNSDTIPDDCELVDNDCQPDGIPDDCQLDVAPGPAPKAVVINEGFEGTIPPTGWSSVVTNAGFTWMAGTFSPPEGAQYADCVYDPALVPQDEWLLSPPLNLNGQVTLTGYTMGSYYWAIDPFDNYDVEAWIIIGGVGGGDDTLIGSLDSDYWVVNFQWESFSYQFAAPAGEFKIGFRYVGVDGAEAGLDLITVDGETGPPANDCNGNAVPDDCEGDADGDGLIDGCDDCTDTDGDGFGNAGYPDNTCPEDNCPDLAGTDQTDTDGDGVGDICDPCTDTDGDGYGNPGYPVNTCPDDNCPNVANNQADADHDGAGDACDSCTDTDGDGYGNPGYPANTCPDDGCVDDPLKSDPGVCGCGVSDDDDSDGDGTPDCIDQCPGVDDDVFAPDCVGAIPTVSQWGLAVLALLLLVSAKLYFGRRKATT